MGTPTFNPNAFPYQIAELGAWAFWSRIEAAGLEPEIEAAMLAGHPLTTEQEKNLLEATKRGQQQLIEAEPYVPYVRPS